MKAESRKQKAEILKRSLDAVRNVFCLLFAAFSFQFSAFAQPSNDIPPLSPAYPEIQPTYWEQHGTIILIGSVAVAITIGIVLWLLLRPRPAAPVPPEILARRALEVLRKRDEDGLVLSEVSQVLRRYVVAAFEMSRDEMTTAELCAALNRNERVGARLSDKLTEFLRRNDERKFSSAVASGRLNAAAHALELIELGEARRAELQRLAATQSKTEVTSCA
jgi:hypothetical protein